MRQPAIISGHPRTMLPATAPWLGVSEITDTEEVTGSNPVLPPALTRGFIQNRTPRATDMQTQWLCSWKGEPRSSGNHPDRCKWDPPAKLGVPSFWHRQH